MTSPQPTFTVPQPKSRRRRTVVLIGGTAVVLAAGGFAAVTLLGTTSETRTGTVSGVESVVVDLAAGNISLQGVVGSDIGILSTLHSSFSSTPVIDQVVTDGVLTITGNCPAPSMNCRVDEEITVPAGTPVTVRTGAGEITATGLDVPQFRGISGTGIVDATFIRPPELVDIETRTGEVTVQVPAAAYRIDAQTTTGTVAVGLTDDVTAQRSLRTQVTTGNVTIRGN